MYCVNLFGRFLRNRLTFCLEAPMGRRKRNRPSLRGSCDVARDAMTLHRRQTPPHVAMEAKSRDKIKPAFSEAKAWTRISSVHCQCPLC